MRGSLFSRRDPPGRACAASAPISSQRNGGKEGPGGFAHPGPPSTGAHGGGGLYRQGKDQPRIAACFPGTHVTGAAAPRAARIGITLQALMAAALYRPGPPGRRWCHAAEIPWYLRRRLVGRGNAAWSARLPPLLSKKARGAHRSCGALPLCFLALLQAGQVGLQYQVDIAGQGAVLLLRQLLDLLQNWDV